MSWDVFISKFTPEQYNDGDAEPLGKREEVIAKITATVPGADFSDPSWGHYKDDSCSIEFSLSDEMVEGMMLHIRGSGDHVIPVLRDLCNKLEAIAMDCSSGETMDFGEIDEASFLEWQAYRDKILKGE